MKADDFISEIEVVRPWKKDDYRIHFALFDFDGTVSLIREGWQQIMIPYFDEVLLSLDTGENREDIDGLVKLFVTDLTGKQTIFQCIRLAEEVEKRGGKPLNPLEYKAEYLRRLESRICDRKEHLASGQDDPDQWLVPGIRDFLVLLRKKGIRLYLASGTDNADVQQEAKLLQIEDLFDGGIWGARDDLVKNLSKEQIKEIKAEVIKDMLQNQHIAPDELVSFGDGFVEIELVSSVGGLTFGAATNEAERKGIDAWKRSRLIAAGAHAIIPDFRNGEKIIQMLS